MDHYTPEARAKRRKYIDITFQHGPIQDVGVNGAHIEDVLDILISRLRAFNQEDSPTRCRENSLAITHLEEAKNWLVSRTLKRVEQGVEGYQIPHRE